MLKLGVEWGFGGYRVWMLDCSGTDSAEGFPEFDGVVVACSDEDDSALVVLCWCHGTEGTHYGCRVVVCRPCVVSISRRSSRHVSEYLFI